MLQTDHRNEAFRRLYEGEDSAWGNNSGGGSVPYWTIAYRAFLERFIHLNNVRTIVDIGCGDWQFTRYIDLDARRYYGFDIVPSVIEKNRAAYGRPGVTFDLMPEHFEELPPADLLIMKDVLQHLPDADILRHKTDLFPRYPTVLVSNSYRKAGAEQNYDIGFGDFRCLDLKAEPYSFPGTYVLEFSSPLYEEIRTLLCTFPQQTSFPG